MRPHCSKRLDGFRVKGGKAQVLRTAGLRVVPFDSAASSDKVSDSPGDGTIVLGLGMPGLIALGMVVTAIALLVGQLLGGTPGRR